MIVSRQHGFVMLASWKCASSTLHARLQHYNESAYSRFYHFNDRLQRVVHQHITYADFLALPEGQAGHFTGAFIRNPYDRVYSGFLQLQRDIQTQPSAAFPDSWVKALVMRQLAENYAQLAAGEFEFDRWFALVGEHQVFETGRNSSFPLYPAHYWTGLNGVQQVDFIGRVEAFETDFDRFCARVGISVLEHPNVNASAPVADLQNPASPCYVARMSRASISKIDSLFAHDFELFGYPRHRP